MWVATVWPGSGSFRPATAGGREARKRGSAIQATDRNPPYAESVMPSDSTLDRYLASRPSDEETAREAVRAYRALGPAARLDALTDLLRGMDVLLRGKRPARAPDDEGFWRHWMDTSLGCPR
jgi:hypothetical protein